MVQKNGPKKLFESGPTVHVLSCTTSAPLAQSVYSSIHALLHDQFRITPRWNDNFPFPFRNLSLMYFHFLFDRKALNLYQAFTSSLIPCIPISIQWNLFLKQLIKRVEINPLNL